MTRQASNPATSPFITKRTRSQYSGSTVIELYPTDFSVLKERYALALHPDTIITGGSFIVLEAFDSGSLQIGDDETANCYLKNTALNTQGVTPLLVAGKITQTLNNIKLTLDALITSENGKALLIVHHVGLNKSDWPTGNTHE